MELEISTPFFVPLYVPLNRKSRLFTDGILCICNLYPDRPDGYLWTNIANSQDFS